MNGVEHDREYIERSYSNAISDFILAKNENEQWDARKDLIKLEGLAVLTGGFEFRDQLHTKLEQISEMAQKCKDGTLEQQCKNCDAYSPIKVCMKTAKRKQPHDSCSLWNSTFLNMLCVNRSTL